ncbi:MAG TPA: hypothetical protein VF623_06425, partial [Segetibacter sp.]
MKGTPISYSLANFAIEKGMKTISTSIPQVSLNYSGSCPYCNIDLFESLQNRTIYFTRPFYICNNCKQLSDLSSYYEHKKLPVLFADRGKTKFPILTINFTPLAERHPKWQKIKKISDRLLHQSFTNFRYIPEILK